MRWSERDIGIAAGLLAPVIGFFVYGLLYVNVIRPVHDLHFFIHDLFLGTRRFQAPIISLSLIADVPVFFFFDRKGMGLAMRGVIMAMFVYAAVIIALWM